MSLRALVTGVSGLKTFNEGLDVIGNNVANVDTVGYRGSRVTYKEVFTQTIKQATRYSNPQQVGLGVKIGSIDVNHSQGNLKSTGRATDMALEGDGFFIGQDNSPAQERIYTRDGSFSVDSSHNLITSNGEKILGWMADPVTNLIDTGGPLVPINIPIGQASFAIQTRNITYGGNLDSTTTVYGNPAVVDPFVDIDVPPVGSNDPFADIKSQAQYTTSNQVYDSLGNGHTLSMYFFKIREVPSDLTAVPPSPAYSDWTFRAILDDKLECQYFLPNSDTSDPTNVMTPPVATTSTVYPAPAVPPGDNEDPNALIVRFDGDGQFVDDTNTIFNPPNGVAGVGASRIPIVVFPGGVYNSISGAAPVGPPYTPPDYVGLNNGADNIEINLNFGLSTQLNGSNTMTANNQDGYSLGTVNGFTIGPDGVVTVSATNGHFRDLGQMAIATFNNPEGLTRVGNNFFKQTPNSGIPQVGEAMTGGRGSISASFLEGSNVDIAEEFTRMIITQRAIQANSRVITTASDVLNEAVNLVR